MLLFEIHWYKRRLEEQREIIPLYEVFQSRTMKTWFFFVCI